MSYKNFSQIAVPHSDIYEGKFTLETYAANLSEVFKNEGPEEYNDSQIFLSRTFVTKNLKEIQDSVKKRLEGDSVDHFKPIKTPFGGGKTHTLIYLYHKFFEWYGKKPIVLVGPELDPTKQTLWGEIEKQLTGKIEKLSGNVSRGSSTLKDVLKDHQPILILIDELLQYISRADGIKVEKTTLGEQSIAFIQELGEAIAGLNNVCVVATLPSSDNEILNNQRGVELFEKIKKFSGRIEDSITPVSDNDIPSIIRARLFKNSEEQILDEAEPIINDFVDYCEDEHIIPNDGNKAEFRDEFKKSYPFLPQVIEVLYKRWGTLQSFQRTRGVLRLLSIVVSDLLNTDKSFISLGDFDLTNERLKGELLRHLDEQFNSVIAQDIVGNSAGATKVNKKLPQILWGKELGTRVARAIFMYSHSGAIKSVGATDTDIMRATVSRGVESAHVSTVLEKFNNELFYLNKNNNKYLFTKEPNILKMKLDLMENIDPQILIEEEKELLKNNITNYNFKIILWPKSSKDIENSHAFKLVILKENDKNTIKNIYNNIGEQPRVYKNNIFILTSSETEKNKFIDLLKSKIAWEEIKNNNISLKDEQIKNLEQSLTRDKSKLQDYLKEYYNTLYVLEKGGNTSKIYLSVNPSTNKKLDQIVYDYLKEESLLNEKIGPILLKSQYLKTNKFVEIDKLYESMLSTPGERRPITRQVLEDTIKEGIKNGEFGLGEMNNESPICKHIREDVQHISFEPGEIIIQSQICNMDESNKKIHSKAIEVSSDTDIIKHAKIDNSITSKNKITILNYSFRVPEGKVNYTSGMLLNIAEKFKNLKLTIQASDGNMSEQDVENLKETLRQMGVTDSSLF